MREKRPEDSPLEGSEILRREAECDYRVQLVATLIIWLHLMTLQLAVEYKKKKSHFILSEKQSRDELPTTRSILSLQKRPENMTKGFGNIRAISPQSGTPSLCSSQSSTVPQGQSLPTTSCQLIDP